MVLCFGSFFGGTYAALAPLPLPVDKDTTSIISPEEWNRIADSVNQVYDSGVLTGAMRLWTEVEGGGISFGGGNVRIGTTDPQTNLHVAGDVKIGTTPAACNASKAGAIRYESGAFQGCDGSAWTALGVPAPVAQDTTPNSFTFVDQTGVNLSTLTTSNFITISGFSEPVSVSVSGDGSPQVSIAGGSWTTSGTISENQSLQVRLTSSGSKNTASSATVTIGSVSDNWSVTTVTWVCGDNVVGRSPDTITYGSVADANGRCWLDRNLGATAVATAYNDANSYGWYYQWGRETDGHQISNSPTAPGPVATIDPNTNIFYTGSYNSIYGGFGEWTTDSASIDWGGAGASNPCPTDWRVPTRDEWIAFELTVPDTWQIGSLVNMMSTPLKLPGAGYRSLENGAIVEQGNSGFYWSNSRYAYSSAFSHILYFNGATMDPVQIAERAEGIPVRCIYGAY